MVFHSWRSLEGIDDYFGTLNVEGPLDIGTRFGVVSDAEILHGDILQGSHDGVGSPDVEVFHGIQVSHDEMVYPDDMVSHVEMVSLGDTVSHVEMVSRDDAVSHVVQSVESRDVPYSRQSDASPDGLQSEVHGEDETPDVSLNSHGGQSVGVCVRSYNRHLHRRPSFRTCLEIFRSS